MLNQGCHERFVLNALRNANSIFGHELFDLTAWRHAGEIDERTNCHKVFYRAIKDTKVGPYTFKEGETMNLGHSIKYPKDETQRLFQKHGFKQAERWENIGEDYCK